MEKWEPPYVPALLYLPKDNRDKPVEYKSSGTEFFEEEVIDFLEKQMRYFNAYIFSINIMKKGHELLKKKCDALKTKIRIVNINNIRLLNYYLMLKKIWVSFHKKLLYSMLKLNGVLEILSKHIFINFNYSQKV